MPRWSDVILLVIAPTENTVLTFQSPASGLSKRPGQRGSGQCHGQLARLWQGAVRQLRYLKSLVCIYATPPKIYHFQLFVDVKEVVFVGNLLQKQSRYTITFKNMSTYSGQKAQHFLKEAICFKLQHSFPCLKKGSFIHRLQFSFQTKYDFVQETVPLQNIEHSSKHAVFSFWRSAVFLSN